MDSFLATAARNLGLLLPLEKETRIEIVSYASSLPDAHSAATYFQELLGDAPGVVEFIEGFCSRRWSSSPTPTPTPPSQKSKTTQKQKPTQKSTQKSSISQLLASAQTKSLSKNTISSSQKTASSSSTSVPTPHTVHHPTTDKQLTSSALDKKPPSKPSSTIKSALKESSIKLKSLHDIDSALRQLESSSSSSTHPCNCQAQRHPLLEVAPNCLNCGKIICVKEGLGPCSFCHTPLLTADEYSAIVTELKQERGKLKTEIHNDQQRAKKSSKSTQISKTYSGSAGGQPRLSASPSPSSTPHSTSSTPLPGLEQATAQLQNLLHFQSTSAQRTRIIDNAADFDLPTSSSSSDKWLTPVERASLIKRQQRTLRKLRASENKRNGRGRRVVSIDLKGNKLVVGDHSETDYSSDEEDIEEEDEIQHIKSQTGFVEKIWDPESTTDSFIKPVYSTSTSTSTKGKKKDATPLAVKEYLDSEVSLSSNPIRIQDDE